MARGFCLLRRGGLHCKLGRLPLRSNNRAESSQHGFLPSLGSRLIIDVTLSAWVDAFGAKLLQPCIKPFTGGAELFVTAVPQSEHGKFQMSQGCGRVCLQP